MSVAFHVVIPMRFSSVRLYGKALAMIAGKPMIQHVYQRAIQSSAKSVTIATDDERILEVAKSFSSNVCMTRATHQCGTERIAEVCEQQGWSDDTIIVNVQGDEPLIPAQAINQVAMNLFLNTGFAMATLCEPLANLQDVLKSSVVKVIFSDLGRALYFSRSPIPYFDPSVQNSSFRHCRHLGIYAYRVGFLKEYVALPKPEIEAMESLEQLRALWYGYQIHVAESNHHFPPGIDTQEDLDRVREYLEQPSVTVV